MRRHRDRERPPTTAFGSHYGVLCHNLRELYERGVKTLPKLELTSAELVCLFAPEKNHDILVRGYAVADVYYNNTLLVPAGLFNLQHLKLSIHLDDQILPPRMPILQVMNGDPDHLNKFVRVRDAYVKLFTEFARCSIVLEKINKLCTSPHQARFLWPGVAFLVAKTKFAEELKNYRTPSSIPPLPPGLRSGCRDTSTMLAALSLLSKTEEKLPRIKVEGRYQDAELDGEFNA